jgi:hypothetical protein
VCFIPAAILEWHTRCAPDAIFSSALPDRLGCVAYNAGFVDLLLPIFAIWTLISSIAVSGIGSSGVGSFAFGIGFFGAILFSLPFFLVFIALLVCAYKLLPRIKRASACIK